MLKSGKRVFKIGSEQYTISDTVRTWECVDKRNETSLIFNTYHQGDPDPILFVDPRDQKKPIDRSAGETKAAYEAKIFTDAYLALSKGGGLDILSIMAGAGGMAMLVIAAFVMNLIQVVPKVK